MKLEYLLFNIAVISAPLLLSFDKRVAFYRRWPQVFLAILAAGTPFLIWDVLVTGRHWFFNDAFTLSNRPAGLPPGEWLFFASVPYACLFTWEVLGSYFSFRHIERLKRVNLLLMLAAPFGLLIFREGLEYTGLVILALGIIAVLDLALQTGILQNTRTYGFLLITTSLNLVCNGYLTARPVVVYGEAYQLGFRIFTIPVEDFGYGSALLLLCLIFYERLKSIDAEKPVKSELINTN